MSELFLGCCFGFLCGFSTGLLFKSMTETLKRRQERDAKDRMYLSIKQLEIEKIMLEMQRKEEKRKDNVLPFKKRTKDDTIKE